MPAPSPRRTPLLAVALLVVAVAVAAAFALRAQAAAPAAGATAPRAVAGAVQFLPSVPEADRAWVRAAIATARPEAQTLVGRVAGGVTVGPLDAGHIAAGAIGLATLDPARPGHARIDLDLANLDGRRVQDRDVVVLHELGHVVDALLLDPALRERLDTGIPRGTGCDTVGQISYGSCAPREERFADTFAKWALRGAVSQVGAGYMIPAPTSLETWGEPLGALAATG